MTTAASATLQESWQRLHPLTPLLRSGRFVVAVLAVFAQQGLQQRPPVLVVIGAVGVSAVVALGLGYLSWRATRYRLAVSGGQLELQVDTGVLQKRSRRVPLARLQSVDVRRPLLARALGLAELRLELAGGGHTEAPLAFLGEDDAHALRGRLLALSTGALTSGALAAGALASRTPSRPEQGTAGPTEPDEALLVQVPTRALVVSLLLGAPVIVGSVMLVAFGLLVVTAPSAAPAVFAAFLPVALGTGSALVRRLLGEYGFTVAESPDGLRLRHGLLETRSQTILSGRVQAVRIREPLLWRRRGWVRVEVDVAGYAHRGQEQEGTSALLPVAPREFATALVDRVLGAALPPAASPVPGRARWRAPLSVRRLRVGLDETHLVATHGWLTVTTDVLPLAKVQSLRLTQGPWQRRLDLASVHADSAGRRLPSAVARHRGADDAAALLAELTRLASMARHR